MIRFTFFLLILCICAEGFGQGKDNSLSGTPFKERIVTGGGFGLGFGTNQDYFSVSPVVGYMLTQKLLAGLGVTYMYTNYKYYTPSIKLNDYGFGPFARLTVYRNVFIQTEYEYLNYEFPVSRTETVRQNFNSFLAGGGFIQPLGENVGLYFMALYNFSYKDPAIYGYSPYSSPLVIRAGINVGNFGF